MAKNDKETAKKLDVATFLSVVGKVGTVATVLMVLLRGLQTTASDLQKTLALTSEQDG